MREELNNEQEQLLEWLESCDFDDLTAKEQLWVKEHLTEKEYRFRRSVITGISYAFAGTPEPRALNIGTTASGKTVPLWQAVTAVAATVAVLLSLWPSAAVVPAQSRREGDRQLSRTDTVIETRVIVDTVVRYMHDRGEWKAEKRKADRVPVEMRPVDNERAIRLPDVSSAVTNNRGRTLSDDTSIHRIISGIYQADSY